MSRLATSNSILNIPPYGTAIGMSDFHTVAKVGEIPDGQGIAYAVEGRMVAVFNEQGNYFAIDDFCPHMGASLAGGHVDQGTVTCPWHAWRFCVYDGTWCDNPRVSIDSFDVEVQGDEIRVRVAKPADPDAGSPGQPDAGSPEQPDVGSPGQPDVGSPEQPDVGSPGQPDVGSPE